MAATIRVNCTYAAHHGFEWAAKINRSVHPPHALIGDQEKSLSWSEPTDIEVMAGESHKLEVYFSVFDVFRMCGAEVEVEPLQDGETRSYQYRVELKDRYFNHGHLSPVG
jgi:hypothetical protein